MDVFNLSNLLILGVVGIVLLIYRQMDKNNRSLDKIRKYADTVRADLEGFIELRTQEIKDFTVELEVHQKTGKEIIKRIKTVEEELAGKAPELETLKGRIEDYGTRIDGLYTLSNQVDENLSRLKDESEFVDKVGRRIKLAAEQIQEIEGSLPELQARFHQDNAATLGHILDQYKSLVARETELVERKALEAGDKTEAYRKFIDGLEDRKQVFMTESQKQLQELLARALDKNQIQMKGLEEHLQQKSRQFEQEWSGAEKAFHKRLEDTAVHAEKFNTDLLQKLTVKIQEQIKTSATAWGVNLQTAAKDVNAGIQNLKSAQDALKEDARDLHKDLQSDMEALETRFSDLQKTAEASGEAFLARVDGKIADQEKSFQYRLTSLESFEGEVSQLEAHLRSEMAQAGTRVKMDLEAFESRMKVLQTQEHQELLGNFTALSTSLGALEKELEDLKAKAYDNVSEKLQVFEDDFFADLQKRNASMSRTFDEWHLTMQTRLKDLAVESETKRQDLEKSFTSLLEEKQVFLQTLAAQNSERLDLQIRSHQSRVEESLVTLTNRLEDSGKTLRDEMGTMERASLAKLEQEIGKHELQLKESLTKLEREMDGKLKGFSERLEGVQGQLQASVNAAESDITIWQTRFSQKVKETENELLDQYQNFKSGINEKITAVKEDFSKQKEDLLLSTNEERVLLKNEISLLKESVNQLEVDVSKRSEAALETFRRDYDSFTVDFQKKTREMTGDLDQRLKEFRSAAQETKDKAEALQKKLFGKIEDHFNLPVVTLEEIDKNQKSFISQTKIFERADILKLELQESIEDLKNDLAKVDLQKKDLVEMDSQMSRIRKMSDEISDKLARFMAEKKRIDLLDSDFSRVLAVSQSVDERLKQITESHDMLQEIQLKIRKLEDYEKDVETRFDRLEKKRTILDTTSDAVDRNYSLLEKMEKSVKDLSGNLGSMPAEVENLKKRFKELSGGKEESESALSNLRSISTLLVDIEKRTEKMEQAREWLARTETRLQEVSQEAEEQVKLLGTLVKASPASASKVKGAPAMDMRQTVVKLSHQGWSKEEISRATKLSMGEVELILELGAR